jgi:predicted transcriptional regulator
MSTKESTKPKESISIGKIKVSSKYLSSLNDSQRTSLEENLFAAQSERCFICGKSIDLSLHKGSIEIDHIEPLSVGGKDEPTNFALVHVSCNRSKLASNLQVARVVSAFNEIKEKCLAEGPNHPTLGDILEAYEGAKYELNLRINNGKISYSLPEIGVNNVTTIPIFKDELSGMQSFFINLPIAYIFQDERINPSTIGSNLQKLVEEFFRKRPQLHIALGWAQTNGNIAKTKIKVFDGQHRAAAQVLLGVKNLPLRVFLNPDLDILLKTNTNAGTILRQVAFDKTVQRRARLRRDRLKVYMDLLLTLRAESTKGRIVLTHVQQKANVPFDRLKEYISELQELSLIQDEAMPKLTEKGLQYIAEYEKVVDFMNRMGLAYR